jgi:hypothetical protein
VALACNLGFPARELRKLERSPRSTKTHYWRRGMTNLEPNAGERVTFSRLSFSKKLLLQTTKQGGQKIRIQMIQEIKTVWYKRRRVVRKGGQISGQIFRSVAGRYWNCSEQTGESAVRDWPVRSPSILPPCKSILPS